MVTEAKQLPTLLPGAEPQLQPCGERIRLEVQLILDVTVRVKSDWGGGEVAVGPLVAWETPGQKYSVTRKRYNIQTTAFKSQLQTKLLFLF